MPASLCRAGPDVAATENPGNGLESGASSDDVAGGRTEGRTSKSDGGHVGLARSLRAVLGRDWLESLPCCSGHGLRAAVAQAGWSDHLACASQVAVSSTRLQAARCPSSCMMSNLEPKSRPRWPKLPSNASKLYDTPTSWPISMGWRYLSPDLPILLSSGPHFVPKCFSTFRFGIFSTTSFPVTALILPPSSGTVS